MVYPKIDSWSESDMNPAGIKIGLLYMIDQLILNLKVIKL
jgi:hypothetical protein